MATPLEDNKEPTATPRLRFPKFRKAAGWKTKLAGDLFANRSEGGEDGLPIYSVTIDDGMVKRSSLDRRVDDISDSDRNKKVHKGDIAYNMMRMWQGAFGVAIEDCMVSPAYVVLEPQDGVLSDFYASLFKLPQSLRLLTSYSHGLTKDRLRLYYKDFSLIPLPQPTSAEQQKIADCLASLNEVIAAQGRKVEALKAHKKGLMQQLFPREGETCPRLRFPEFRRSSEWIRHRMADLLERAYKPVDVDAHVQYREIGVRSHGNGVFHKDPVSGKAIGNKRVFWVVPDAFVVNIIFAWEQAVATTSVAENGMIASHRFPMYLAKPGRCNVEFLKRSFLTPQGKHLLGLASPGGAGRNRTLGQAEFEKIEIVLPKDVEEQLRIADCLSSLDAQIAAESGKLDALKTHKKGLMQQLFPVPEGD